MIGTPGGLARTRAEAQGGWGRLGSAGARWGTLRAVRTPGWRLSLWTPARLAAPQRSRELQLTVAAAATTAGRASRGRGPRAASGRARSPALVLRPDVSAPRSAPGVWGTRGRGPGPSPGGSQEGKRRRGDTAEANRGHTCLGHLECGHSASLQGAQLARLGGHALETKDSKVMPVPNQFQRRGLWQSAGHDHVP